MSFFLTSSRFVGEQYRNRAKRLLINLAKMSRITNSESINLSDNYAVLLDETLWENPALRATLIKRDEQNVCNIQGLSDKVAPLCHLMSERNHAEQNETVKEEKYFEGACPIKMPGKSGFKLFLQTATFCH